MSSDIVGLVVAIIAATIIVAGLLTLFVMLLAIPIVWLIRKALNILDEQRGIHAPKGRRR